MHLRRLIAVILLLAFGASVAEAGMADVHDGDATHSELERYDAVVTHDDAAPVDTGHSEEPAQSGHEQHSCHCAHIHFGWVAGVAVSWPAVFIAAAAPQARAASPLSAVRSLPLRPPIA